MAYDRIDVARLERISRAVERHIGPQKHPGCVTLVARDGEIVHLKAHGAHSYGGTPMRTDSIFRLYSMTKPISAVAAMILVEEGLIRLVDPISRFIPQASDLKVLDPESESLDALQQPITVRHLLTHTAGFTYPFYEGKVEAIYRELQVFSGESLADLVDKLMELPLAFQPGTDWRYAVSNDVLARIVEIASEMEFDRFLQDRLLRPLGMVDTDFFVPAPKHDRFVSMYGSQRIEDPGVVQAEQIAAADRGEISLLGSPDESLESGPHRQIRGGHGLVSTARDYFRFCQMLLNGGNLDGVTILGRKTVELMTRNALGPRLLPYGDWPSEGRGWGLGFSVTMDNGVAGSIASNGTYGWGGAAGTRFWIDPSERLVALLMAQFQPGEYYPVGEDFLVSAYQAIT